MVSTRSVREPGTAEPRRGIAGDREHRVDSPRRIPRCSLVLLALLALLAAVGFGAPAAAAGDWVDLLADGLEGWEQRGGQARYRMAGGTLIGTAVADTPNSFLCTRRSFADFVLQLEFKVDDGLNSGIQIRSHAYPSPTHVRVQAADGSVSDETMPAGRVHGYQVEIDPTERAWSAGIYDEARRGWLSKPDGDDPASSSARRAFVAGQWNALRIEAIGSSIRTWLNGVPVADLDDDMTAAGFIALQVHGVGDDAELAGSRVRWRGVRIRELPGSGDGGKRGQVIR